MKKFVLIFLLLVQIAGAQTDSVNSTDSLKYFKLNVLSNPENARIFIDTTYIGMTPLIDYELSEGVYNLKAINPKSLQDWQNDNQLIKLDFRNDTTINLDFKYYYFFNTVPFNASVFRNDSLLGMTPLRFFNDRELSGSLIFRKKNFKDYIFDLSSYDFETGANITLQSKGTEAVNDIVYKNRSTQFKTKRNIAPILFLSAAVLAGGYFAVDFKNKSNDDYDLYLSSENPEYLNSSNNNDTYFIISLVLMEAAVGGLIYFLFFD